MAYTTYSASQAVERANATTTWQTAMCLEFVWHCLTTVRAGIYDANDAWAAAKQKVTTSTPPPGAPVYFRGFAHGHIALSLGGGRIRSTDWPTKGRVGTTTIGDLCREWYGSQANYLGWSRDYAGNPIRGLEETSTVNSGTPPLPATTSEEDDMPTAEEIARAVWSMTVSRNGEKVSALQELADAKTYLIEARDNPQETADKVWARTVSRNGQNVAALQELADAKTAAMTAASATAILTRLDSLKAALPGLPDDADVAALKAQLDELKALVAALPKG